MNSPVYLLASIIALCAVYAIVVVILDLTGNEGLVGGFTGVFLPVIMSLLTMKIDMIRRLSIKQTSRLEDKIENSKHQYISLFNRANDLIAELRDFARQQHPKEAGEKWPREGRTGSDRG